MTSKPTSMTLVSALLLATLTLPAFGQSANLANPSALSETAPATYKARFETSKGAFVVDVTRDWAPNGADRFYNLVKNGFYDGVRFFRVLDGFMAQFGINGDPEDLGGVARSAHPGRSGEAEQPPRLHHLCDGRSGHAHQPGLHQLRRQQLARQAEFLAVRPGVVGHGSGRRAATTATAKARRAGRAPTRAASRRKAMPIWRRTSRGSTSSRRRPSPSDRTK